MKYSDFRPKAILFASMLIFCSITFLSGIELMSSLIYWNIGNPGITIKFALIKNGAVGIPLILLFCVWCYRFLDPLHKAFALRSTGADLPAELRILAQTRIRKLRRRFLAANYAVYGATALISVIQGGFSNILTPTGILQIILYLVMSNIAALMEAAVVSNLIGEPRKMLAVYRMDEESSKEMGLRNHLILINISLVAFVVTFLLYTNMSAIMNETLYTESVEKIVSGEMTMEEAKALFQEEGSKIIHVPSFDIGFPLDQSGSGNEWADSLQGSLFLILFLLLITYLVERIAADGTVHQMRSVSRKLKEMLAGSGDLTQRVEITQFDEMGHLVSDLNGLMDSLQKVFIDVRQTSRVAAESALSLGKEIEVTSGSGEKLAESVKRVAGTVETSLVGIEANAKDLAEVFGSLDNIIASVDSQAAFVNQTSGAVTEMAANVKSVSEATIRANGLATKLSKAAVDGNTSVSNSIQAIKKVEESSKKVTEMVSIISQIASQTNLLAMNAAIEAAHAGEAGKGFAVVANEVRSLAESSAKSAKEITVQIKTMLETVRDGVSLSTKAGAALDCISTDISATTGLVKQIADAMNEQSLAANDILESITNLVDETQSIKNNAIEQKRRNDSVRGEVVKNTNNMKEITALTKEQAADGQRIIRSIADLKSIQAQNAELSKKLSALVEGFKLD